MSHVVEVASGVGGRLAAPNWPQLAPARAALQTRLIAPHQHTLTLAFTATTLVASGEEPWPCGEGSGWIQVCTTLI